MDLSRLNPPERHILALLAQGHTAKSIADVTGCSVHAVNERLREARRKTGATSSRELARRYAAQENRDEQFGVAASAGPEAHRARNPAVRKITTMAAVAFVPLAAAAMLLIPGAVPEGPPRVVRTLPAADAVLPPGPVTISVTFDRPMRPGSYSFVMLDPATYPACASVAYLSADGRTYSLDCRLEPDRSYAIGFNRGRFRNFVGRDGVAAEPHVLHFSTR